jgi:hypothetical protein
MKQPGKIRMSQAVLTFGPGALIDLPEDSAIVGGLEWWPSPDNLDQIIEPRLVGKLQGLTGVAAPRLYSPPPDTKADFGKLAPGITAWRFPEWFVVQDEGGKFGDKSSGRRLVHEKVLDKGRLVGEHAGKTVRIPVVPVRFVKACPRGHVEDIDWRGFVHGKGVSCKRQLWMKESGTSGDLSELRISCECGSSRKLHEASTIDPSNPPLGFCRGRQPWLGGYANEDCDQHGRLLIRTASNAYFPQTVSVLSLPDQVAELDSVIEGLWDFLETSTTVAAVDQVRAMFPKVASKLEGYSSEEVFRAIQKKLSGAGNDTPVKAAEIKALISQPEGYGDDVPIDYDFHARRLPRNTWAHSQLSDGIDAVVQVHRLREVMALAGFTRFEPIMPDIHGEYENAENQAEIAENPSWFPAVENRGEGVLITLKESAVASWMERDEVKARLESLQNGHEKWLEDRQGKGREFPGGIYVLLHTLSHLLIQSLSMRCGYPASSIRERIYAEDEGYGVLLYTASPDAEGTLGGLVQEARHIEDHLKVALEMARLCSSDPVCSQHASGASLEGRFLHGAACHSCSLVAETSCEMRNEYLDRALVASTLDVRGAGFFGDEI